MTDLLRELATGMLRHPYAQRYATRSRASGDNRVRTADDVLGERLHRLGGFLWCELERPGFAILPTRTAGRERAEGLAATIALMGSATPYLWTEEVRAAVRQIELPQHVLSPRVLPQPRSWHTFATGITLGGELEADGRHFKDGVGDAIFVADAGRGLQVLILGEMTNAETGEPHPSMTGGSFAYGRTWPDDFAEPEQTCLHAPLLMFAFLNSPYIPKHRALPSRAARREAVRLSAGGEDDLVTFVDLRRPARRHDSDDAEGDPVHWKHQWVVSGHVRAQWYPTEQAHRLIWIAPHLKGPADAPLLDHAYKVVR